MERWQGTHGDPACLWTAVGRSALPRVQPGENPCKPMTSGTPDPVRAGELGSWLISQDR